MKKTLFEHDSCTNFITPTTFKKVSGNIISNLPFPLPPQSEQHRIAAKVDELMVLCDEIEAQLMNTITTCALLLEATLQDAVSA
jgi:type I restriction enzyme, S subunit